MSQNSNPDKYPLGRVEVFCSGFMLIIGTSLIVAASSIGTLDMQLGDIDTESELVTMHDKLKNERTEIMASAALFWLALPFMVLHLYCICRVIGSLFSVYDSYVNYPYSYCFRKIYTIIAILLMVSFLIILPTIIMTTVYFSWEFTDDDGDSTYTGYYIQLLLAHITTILHDSASVPLVPLANLPWVWFLLTNHHPYLKPKTEEEINARDSISSNIMCCRKQCGKSLCATLMLIEVILMIVLTCMCVFSWDSSGFWSYYGDSQSLNDFGMLSSYLLGIWLIYISFKLDSIQNNVQTVKEYQSIGGGGAINDSNPMI